ncbi:TetR family transcriptional regulator [Candidatus Binatus sp.]|uniref:TetR family transcriptional regulator n=1 Tax=Candidatus Binatus sp. TaxID=2811406 RepID=UPI003C466768
MKRPAESFTNGIPQADALRATQLARRKRIVAAAMDLAAHGGYDAVQMRDVAARAKVALGTLYRYFSSKDQLLAYTWTDWSQELQEHLWRHPIRGATRADRIMDFVRRVTRALEREPRLASALLKSMLVPDSSAEEPRKEVSAVMFRVVEEELATLRPDDREGIRDILGQVWYANLLLWVNGRIPVSRLYQNMETACRLLISHHEA